MSTHRSTLVALTALIAATTLALAGCPPEDTPDASDTGSDVRDTMEDTDEGEDADTTDMMDADGESDDDCSSDSECSSPTPVCNTTSGECVECTEMSQCGTGQICDDSTNTCESGQCSQGGVGSSCDPNASAGKGWRCVDAGKGPVCMQTCVQGDDDSSSSCGAGRVCLPSGQDGEPAVCYPSQCAGPTDSGRCSDVQNHPLFGSYPDGAKCSPYTVENCGSATLCIPAGTQSEGEGCTTRTPAACENPDSSACKACEAGLTCQGGACRTACTSNGDCSGDDECIGQQDQSVIQQGTGFCAEPCQPYDGNDQCDQSGEGCQPVGDDGGYCDDVGTKGYMESCSPPGPSAPNRAECAEGLACVTFQRTQLSTVARCVPTCATPSAGESETLDNQATCGGTFYGRVTHGAPSPAEVDVYTNGNQRIEKLSKGDTGAGSSTATADYFEIDVDQLNRGSVDVAVTDGSASNPSNPLAQTNVTVASGLVQTWLVHSTGQPTISAIPEQRGVEQPASGSGQANIRVGSVVPDFESNGNSVDVDIVAVPKGSSLSSNKVVLAEELGSAGIGSYTTVPSGEHTLYAFPTTASQQSGNELWKRSGVQVPERSRPTVIVTGTASTSDSVSLDLATIPYASAPDAPRFRCLGGGICLNECQNRDYGTDWCQSGNQCSPLRGASEPSFCTPSSGDTATGDSCSPSGLTSTCEAGAVCNNGTCRSLCIGGSDDSNASLQCSSGTTCAAGNDALGGCRDECSPGNNLEDTNCPSGQQACIPRLVGENNSEKAFCENSGSKQQGDSCGGEHSGDARGQPLTQDCEPGTICAHPKGGTGSQGFSLSGMFSHKGLYGDGICPAAVDEASPPTQPTCRPTCDPFADNPDCPGDQACGLDLVHGTALVGVCLERAEQVSSSATNTRCGTVQGNVGKMCGDASHCLTLQAGGSQIQRCFQFCKTTEDNPGCSGQASCQPVEGLGQGVGLCRQ